MQRRGEVKGLPAAVVTGGNRAQECTFQFNLTSSVHIFLKNLMME